MTIRLPIVFLPEAQAPIVASDRAGRQSGQRRARVPRIYYVNAAPLEIVGVTRSDRQTARFGDRCNQAVKTLQVSTRVLARDNEIAVGVCCRCIEIKHSVGKTARRQVAECHLKITTPSAERQTGKAASDLGEIYGCGCHFQQRPNAKPVDYNRLRFGTHKLGDHVRVENYHFSQTSAVHEV